MRPTNNRLAASPEAARLYEEVRNILDDLADRELGEKRTLKEIVGHDLFTEFAVRFPGIDPERRMYGRDWRIALILEECDIYADGIPEVFRKVRATVERYFDEHQPVHTAEELFGNRLHRIWRLVGETKRQIPTNPLTSEQWLQWVGCAHNNHSGQSMIWPE